MRLSRWKKENAPDSDLRVVILREIAYKSGMDKVPLLDGDDLRGDLGMSQKEIADLLEHLRWWCNLKGRPSYDVAQIVRTVGDVLEYVEANVDERLK